MRADRFKMQLEDFTVSKDMVQLTEHLHVMNKAHILYCYETREQYVKNAVAYIVTGIACRHHLMMIEAPELYSLIESKLATILPTEEYRPYLHYLDKFTFYYGDEPFQYQNIISDFRHLLIPLLDKKVTLRTWVHVDGAHREDSGQKLKEFEFHANAAVKNLGVLSVCAYDANLVPASLLPAMLRSHEYYMTDVELVKSPLYRLEVSPLPEA